MLWKDARLMQGGHSKFNAKVSCDGRQQDRRGMSSLSINEISRGPAAAAVQQYQIMPPNDNERWQTSGSVEMTSSFGSKHSARSAGRLVHTRQLLLFTTVILSCAQMLRHSTACGNVPQIHCNTSGVVQPSGG